MMMPVASPATQWIVLPIPCFQSGGNEFLVRTRTWFLVCQHVEQQTDRAEIEGYQHKPPFHHHGFGIVAELIPGHIKRTQSG